MHRFRQICRVLAVALAACLLALACGTPTDRQLRVATGPDAARSVDGLYKVENSRWGVAFVKPGVDLRAYDKVILKAVELRYRKTPRSRDQGSIDAPNFELSEPQKQRIKRIFHETFARQLAKSSIYTLVDAPGPDVLFIEASILDLVVNVPTRASGDADTILVSSIADMTLVLEIGDSESDELYARLADREGLSGAQPSLSNANASWSDLKMQFNRWAGQLRRGLDTTRELPSLPHPTSAGG